MAKEVTQALAEAAPSAHTEVQRVLDMRYRGQRFELSVTVPDGKLDSGLMASVRSGSTPSTTAPTAAPVPTSSWRSSTSLSAGGCANPVGVERLLGLPPSVPRAATTRGVPIRPDRATPVIPRAALSPEPRQGPLVIEDMDSTTLVPPEATAHRDRFNNIVISWTTTAPQAATSPRPISDAATFQVYRTR
ncbi:hypothetical protein SANTM175S_08103 [Streptomyces antimycoticus]